jgi:hypothetical protein
VAYAVWSRLALEYALNRVVGGPSGIELLNPSDTDCDRLDKLCLPRVFTRRVVFDELADFLGKHLDTKQWHVRPLWMQRVLPDALCSNIVNDSVS